MGHFSSFGLYCQQCYYVAVDAKTAKNILFSGLLLILSVSSVVSTINILKRGERLIEAKRQLEALQQQKDYLEREAEYRKSPEFVEQEARNKLNMTKPGEEVYLKPKILGDDLLGAEDARTNELFGSKAGKTFDGSGKSDSPDLTVQKATIFTRLFDKIRELLLLFQS